MLHKYSSRDLSQFLDIFDRDVVDDEGENLGVVKTDEVFFEKIVGILPMYIKQMNNLQIVRTLEVCVRRNIGSQRMFDNYILAMIERHVLKYSPVLYSRMIRAMADKGFVEDYVFWEKFAFKYVYTDPRNDGKREFSHDQAKMLWDSFVYLKLKCPTLDIKDVLV
jgi:hypothetical protein